MDGGAWWAAVHGVAKSWTWLSNFTFTFSLSCIGEGNGNPLQCSCLENPRGRIAWWADVYGITQSQTRLKWLSSSINTLWSLLSDSQCILNLPGKVNTSNPFPLVEREWVEKEGEPGEVPGAGASGMRLSQWVQSASIKQTRQCRAGWWRLVGGLRMSL